MLYTIESTLGGFGDVLVEIFALPKACHSGSVLPLLPLWQGFAHHGYGSGANWDFNSAKPSCARSACSNDESNAHNFIKQHIALHYFKVFP